MAVEATLYAPAYSRMNSLGELIVADKAHYRVRKILTNGTIITIAGNGIQGNSKDGIMATEANLLGPFAIAIDYLDQVYFSDGFSIRKILNNGTLITYAGNGILGYSGDGDLAVNAKFQYPRGIYWDKSTGNLLIADMNNNRVRKVSNSTGIITTIAGTGVKASSGDGGLAINAQLFLPNDVHVNSQGEILISESQNTIRKILTNGTITTIADSFRAPSGVFSSSKNNDVFVSDDLNDIVGKVISNGKVVTVAGIKNKSGFSGDKVLANSSQLNSPNNVFESVDGSLYIADTTNNRIRKVLPNGIITTFAGTGSLSYCKEGQEATNGPLGQPRGLYLLPSGELLFAEYEGHRIRKILTDNTIITIAGTGEGGFNGDGILATNAMLKNPSAVTMDAEGQIYIVDTKNCRIRKILTHGTITTIAGTGTCGFNGDNILAIKAKLNEPEGIVVSSTNEIYLADTLNNRVRKILTNGTIITYAGSGSQDNKLTSLATTTSLNLPVGLLIDEIDSSLYVSVSQFIYKVFTNNSIVLIAGEGGRGLHLLNGTLYFVDTSE